MRTRAGSHRRVYRAADYRRHARCYAAGSRSPPSSAASPSQRCCGRCWSASLATAADDRRSGTVTALTEVELIHLEGKIERWIRFGRQARGAHPRPSPPRSRVRARKRCSRSFAGRPTTMAPSSAASTWLALRRCRASRSPPVPFVTTRRGDPSAHFRAGPGSQQVLAAIDQVEALDVRAEDACPDHWRHVHNRITAGEAPRAYTRERHAAWLLRRRITA